MSKPIIAVDGPAASGKGSLARKLAEYLDFAYMDTGVLYRAVGFEVLDDGLSVKDKRDCINAAQTLVKKLKNSPDTSKILSNPRLRDDDIGNAASKVAAIPEVREALNSLQRNFAESPGQQYKGAILDGRDIGTIICPKADLKFFITCDVEIRAKRRLKELQSKGLSVTYSTVLEDMRERDVRDAHTLEAHEEDGYVTNILDTSHLSADEAFEAALKIIEGQTG